MLDAFFIQSDPLNAERGHFSVWLILLSYAIASLGAFTALSFVQNMATEKLKSAIRVDHLCGAFALGGGIWSMHYIGMLAYRSRLEVHYDVGLTAISFLAAVVAGYMALEVAQEKQLKTLKLALMSLLLGTGICVMHYLGMAAMIFDGDLRYKPFLFLASFLIAVAASAVALCIFYYLKTQFEDQGKSVWLRLGISLILGLAICGMHYTGMAAAVFIPHYPCLTNPDQGSLEIAIVTAIFTVVFLTLGLTLIHFKKLLIGQGLVLAIAMILGVLVHIKAHHDYDIQIEIYKQVSHEAALRNARDVEQVLGRIYRGLNRIAYTPGLRHLTAQSPTLDSDHIKLIQQLFNDLSFTIKIDKIIIHYKKGITASPNSSQKLSTHADIVFEEDEVSSLFRPSELKPESTGAITHALAVENYTQLIDDQFKWFQKNNSQVRGIAELYPPLISGHKVISGSGRRDDEAILFSIPFFTEAGVLNGTISCVIPLKVLVRTLPERDVALLNPNYDLYMSPSRSGQQSISWSFVLQAQPDPSLIYSEIIPIDINDPLGQWYLWTGKSDREFLSSASFKNIEAFKISAYSIVAFLMLISSTVLYLLHQNFKILRSREVTENTTEIKNKFMANMSHEIRTPLNGVLATTELLKDTTLDAKQKIYVDVINNSGTLLGYLLNEILDYSELELGKLSLKPEVISLRRKADILKSLYEATAQNKGLKLLFDYDPQLPDRVFLDPFRLFQVMQNLVNNAISHTHSGVIVVSFKQIMKENSPHLQFSVADTGVGIPKENLNKIFEEYVRVGTSAFSGSAGLGLAICKSIVELMQGTIAVESELNKGSKFSVIIPIILADGRKNRPYALTSVGAINPKEASGKVLRTLLVDDVETNRFVLAEMLEKLGCQVVLAENGKVAVEKNSKDDFDIIFMDCSMPVMNGFEATKAIRRHGFINPIVAVTAYYHDDEIQHCYSVGMNDVLEKPVRIELLLNKIRQWVPQFESSESVSSDDKKDVPLVVSQDNPVESDANKFDVLVLGQWMAELPGKAKTLITLTLKDAETYFGAIEEACRNKDALALQENAHALKSIASQVGGIGLSALSKKMEMKGREQNWQGVEALLSEMKLSYQDFLRELSRAANIP